MKKSRLLLFIAMSCLSAFAFATDPVTVCSGISYPAVTPATAQVRADGTSFRAADGRYVLLRGVNASGNSKVPPFMPLTSPALLDPLAPWGVNTIRLLFTWQAFEPAPCSYSEEYLAYYEQVVKWAAERGIYVIADFHQDAFSRWSLNGCGEGAPEWALTGMVKAAKPDNGFESCADWGAKSTFNFTHYLTFDRFFKDDKRAFSHYVEMTRRVASRLSQYPNVIGYDMMNEPASNGDVLNPFYTAVGKAIRQKHPSAMLFFEPELNTIGPMIPISFSRVTKPPLDNVVFAPHFYSADLFALRTWLGGDPGQILAQWKKKTDAWNIPMLLGEYGATPVVKNSANYMEALYKWLDLALVSGTQWTYNPGWTPTGKDGWNDEDFSINDEKLQLRTALFTPRPYPQKTAGRPLHFVRLAAGLEYSWNNDPSLGSGKTEIYIPEGFATGKTWKTFPSGQVTCKVSGHLAVCESAYRGMVAVSLK